MQLNLFDMETKDNPKQAYLNAKIVFKHVISGCEEDRSIIVRGISDGSYVTILNPNSSTCTDYKLTSKSQQVHITAGCLTKVYILYLDFDITLYVCNLYTYLKYMYNVYILQKIRLKAQLNL